MLEVKDGRWFGRLDEDSPKVTQVGTLVLLVEPLDDAYTGPLFTLLWEGLYRRFTNPVGALLAGCAGCRISLYRVYENPVCVLHGRACTSPMERTRRIVSGFDL